jgi:NADH pyrophosphatase NudC (nudix superfamily)
MSLYNYCTRCGSDNITLENAVMYLCNNCGLEVYLNPKPTTNIIFYNDKKVLIAQRARDPDAGYWGLPGGFMENGETLEECTQREVMEELGFKSENPKYFCSIYSPEYIYNNENYPNICVIMFEPISIEQINQIKPEDDVSSVKLITRSEIDQLDFCFDIDKLLNKFFDEILDKKI